MGFYNYYNRRVKIMKNDKVQTMTTDFKDLLILLLIFTQKENQV